MNLGSPLNIKLGEIERPLLDDFEASLATKCEKFKGVVLLENPQAASCRPGVKVGYDSWGESSEVSLSVAFKITGF